MKMSVAWAVLVGVWASADGTRAQVRFVPEERPPGVFTGVAQTFPVRWRNEGSTMIEMEIRMRTMQLSSATAAPVCDAPWKHLRVLPGQTVLETVSLAFPAVKAETRFLVQWLENSNRVVGATEIFVYPTNLLSELRPLVGKEGELGVFDPGDELKGALSNAGVEFIDLGNTVLENFRGTLAIIGPFDSKMENRRITSAQIKTLLKNGVGMVWVRPGPDPLAPEDEDIQPSFYTVPENHRAAVVVQPELLANLERSPRAQLNLVQFCKLALHPRPWTLPAAIQQP